MQNKFFFAKFSKVSLLSCTFECTTNSCIAEVQAIDCFSTGRNFVISI